MAAHAKYSDVDGNVQYIIIMRFVVCTTSPWEDIVRAVHVFIVFASRQRNTVCIRPSNTSSATLDSVRLGSLGVRDVTVFCTSSSWLRGALVRMLKTWNAWLLLASSRRSFIETAHFVQFKYYNNCVLNYIITQPMKDFTFTYLRLWLISSLQTITHDLFYNYLQIVFFYYDEPSYDKL